MTDLDQAIATAIIAHSPGWTPARELDLTSVPGLGAAATLEYRRIEIHDEVEPNCWSVTDGWRVALLDAAGTVLLRHVEPYSHPAYPDDEYVRAACRDLVASWRAVLAAARQRREQARAWAATVQRLDPEERVAAAAGEVEAGRLALAETAAALGVDPQAILAVIDQSAWERQLRAAEAKLDAMVAAIPDEDLERQMYVSAAELAAYAGKSPDTVRRDLSRAGVAAHHYVGRYRTAMYPRGAAEDALHR